MALTKIISGGQTGADQAGLRAAKALGLETGGTAPYGWWTEEGPQMTLLESYNLVEGEPDSKTYPKRTARNVIGSDGTVAFGIMSSYGEILTRNLCTKNRKPYIANPSQPQFINWIEQHNIHVLNVAGNRESVNLGIGQVVFDFLTSCLIKEE